ncbi:MAG TPA: CAP domain-containing protein [Gaiellaceae bacterium]|nr:CAP domain-containing protein [Gaiellaceae bacterium]
MGSGLIRLVLALAGLALFAGCLRAAGVGRSPVAQAASVAMTPTELQFVTALERVRDAHGLSPLTPDGRLAAAARGHSAEMIARDYFAHGAFWLRIEHEGLTTGRAGETLGWCACSQGPVSRLVDMWLASPEHRSILLDPGYRQVGVGVSVGRFLGRPRVLVVTADFHRD